MAYGERLAYERANVGKRWTMEHTPKIMTSLHHSTIDAFL